MAHGGKRVGAGRKNGAVSQRTQDIAAAVMTDGLTTPLEYLIGIMRDVEADEAKRIDCAKAAAPYVHAKLNSIEAKIDADVAINTLTHRIIDGRATD